MSRSETNLIWSEIMKIGKTSEKHYVFLWLFNISSTFLIPDFWSDQIFFWSWYVKNTFIKQIMMPITVWFSFLVCYNVSNRFAIYLQSWTRITDICHITRVWITWLPSNQVGWSENWATAMCWNSRVWLTRILSNKFSRSETLLDLSAFSHQ